MRLGRTARIRGEGSGPLLVILALILGGIVWWLYSSRQDAQKTVRTFAAEIATRTAVKYDAQYLNLHMSPAAQGQYLVSWRDRLFARLREFGVPEQPIDIQGDVAFTSYFFDPHGLFKAQLKYPTTTAQLELGISRGMTNWQIDSIEMAWNPPPAPTPGPTPMATPTPTPTPTPEPENKPRRKRKG
jgi:hypothetical protein